MDAGWAFHGLLQANRKRARVGWAGVKGFGGHRMCLSEMGPVKGAKVVMVKIEKGPDRGGIPVRGPIQGKACGSRSGVL